MSDIAWPNEASPGLSHFQLDVPDSWTAIEPPGALLGLLGPDADGFRPNLIVFGQRMRAAVTIEEVVEQTVSDASSIVVERGQVRPGTADRLPTVMRRSAEVTHGIEIHHLAVATEADDSSPAGLRSVYTLVGSFQAAHMDEDERTIRDMIASFTVQVPAPVGTDR